jgi:hypothetical protein
MYDITMCIKVCVFYILILALGGELHPDSSLPLEFILGDIKVDERVLSKWAL